MEQRSPKKSSRKKAQKKQKLTKIRIDGLKRCPFCGAKPKYIWCTGSAGNESISEHGYPAYEVLCINQVCKVSPRTHPCLTDELAYRAWNQRLDELEYTRTYATKVEDIQQPIRDGPFKKHREWFIERLIQAGFKRWEAEKEWDDIQKDEEDGMS